MSRKSAEQRIDDKSMLGIIGGMGPAASAEFYCRVVDLTVAEKDGEHVATIMISDPRVPDRTRSLQAGRANVFADFLNREARQLVALGCSVLAMPCNTAHACLDEIASGISDVVMLDMPLETLKLAASLGYRRIGLLATDGTVEAGVYHQRAATCGLEIVVPSPLTQAMLMDEIYGAIKAGKQGDPERIIAAESEFASLGCDASIIACTELSISAKDAPKVEDIARLDALDVLAWRSVEAVGAKALDLAWRYQHE